jgi:hypothetical protein
MLVFKESFSYKNRFPFLLYELISINGLFSFSKGGIE